MPKQVANLYRQLADKLDDIEALELQLETEKQIRQTTEEQLKIAENQIKILSSENQETLDRVEGFRLMAVSWREKALNNVDLLKAIDSTFSKYSTQDFIDLECLGWESRDLIPNEDAVEYSKDIEYIDNLINLAEELKLIKGEFFDESEGEEAEQLVEF